MFGMEKEKQRPEKEFGKQEKDVVKRERDGTCEDQIERWIQKAEG